jgi:hypothetical protein
MAMKRGAILSCVMLLVACQWVPLTPGGEKVRVGTAAEVEVCKLLGSVTGKTTVTVGPMARDEAKVGREVEALARNEAASMGGNVIVPKGPLDWDQRAYAVYRCDV